MKRHGGGSACLDYLRVRRKMVELPQAEGKGGPKRERFALLDQIGRAEKVANGPLVIVGVLPEGALRSRSIAHGEERGLNGRWKFSRRQHWRKAVAG